MTETHFFSGLTLDEKAVEQFAFCLKWVLQGVQIDSKNQMGTQVTIQIYIQSYCWAIKASEKRYPVSFLFFSFLSLTSFLVLTLTLVRGLEIQNLLIGNLSIFDVESIRK